MALKDLLKKYNDLAAAKGQPTVKRFADAATAEKRIAKLQAGDKPTAASGKPAKAAKPAPKATKPAPAKAPKATKPAPAADRSSAIAASWSKPGVRAARSKRHAVTHNRQTYRSLTAATAAVGMDLGYKVIPLRAVMVRDGMVEIEGKKFHLATA
jgi:hypothetical protein